MDTYVYLWVSDKLKERYGIVNCYGDDENGFVCVDEYDCFAKEFGLDKINVIGYFDTVKDAEEYLDMFFKGKEKIRFGGEKSGVE